MKYSNEYLDGIEAACLSIAKMQGLNPCRIEAFLPTDIVKALCKRRERAENAKMLADAVRTCQQAGYVVTDPNG